MDTYLVVVTQLHDNGQRGSIMAAKTAPTYGEALEAVEDWQSDEDVAATILRWDEDAELYAARWWTPGTEV